MRRQVGHLAPVDRVSGRHDAALRGLPEDVVEARDRDRIGADQVGENLSGTDRGQLVRIADDQQRGMVRQRAQERGHQANVHHRGFVEHEKVARHRHVRSAPKTADRRADEAMHRLGVATGHRGQAPRRAPGRRAQSNIDIALGQHMQEAAHQRGLADTGAAGDDQHLRPAGSREGLGAGSSRR